MLSSVEVCLPIALYWSCLGGDFVYGDALWLRRHYYTRAARRRRHHHRQVGAEMQQSVVSQSVIGLISQSFGRSNYRPSDEHARRSLEAISSRIHSLGMRIHFGVDVAKTTNTAVVRFHEDQHSKYRFRNPHSLT